MSQEIITPEVEIACCENLHFQIEKGKATDKEKVSDWYTSGISVNVKIDPENNMPFRVTSKAFKYPSNIEITIAKTYKEPVLLMQVENFGSLPTLFSQGTLHAVVSGHFAAYNFTHKPTSLEILTSEENGEGKAEGEIYVIDEFLQNFDTKVGAKTHIGQFTVNIFWKVSFAQLKMNYIDKLESCTSDDDIQSLEGTVQLVADKGEVFKFSKALLAVISPKFKAQFQQDASDKLTMYFGDESVMSEETLRAFLQFTSCFSLKKPVHNCSVALDLLMAGHYHMMTEMEEVMQNILLAKPAEWFDLETSVRLFLYASKICLIIDNEEERSVWENLNWKALRNIRTATEEDSKKFEEIKKWIPDSLTFGMLKMLLSVA